MSKKFMSKSVERRLKVQKGCSCGECDCDNVLPDESDIIMNNLAEKMFIEANEKYHLVNEQPSFEQCVLPLVYSSKE